MYAEIHEINAYRNAGYVFKDRFEAGDILGRMLEPEYKDIPDVMVLAIPSGGVPVGLKISEKLHAPFDVIIVRKIPIPGNPEAGFGAVTLDGSPIFNQPLLYHLGLRSSQISHQVDVVKKELRKRNELFRQGYPFPDLSDKMVILVDDGLASGYTMMASIQDVRKRGPQKIIIAVPTAPLDSIHKVTSLVEEIYCANIKQTLYFAVADAYKHWYDLGPEEVIKLLKKRE